MSWSHAPAPAMRSRPLCRPASSDLSESLFVHVPAASDRCRRCCGRPCGGRAAGPAHEAIEARFAATPGMQECGIGVCAGHSLRQGWCAAGPRGTEALVEVTPETLAGMLDPPSHRKAEVAARSGRRASPWGCPSPQCRRRVLCRSQPHARHGRADPDRWRRGFPAALSRTADAGVLGLRLPGRGRREPLP